MTTRSTTTAVCLVAAACAERPQPAPDAASEIAQAVTYSADGGVFHNPERGFHTIYEITNPNHHAFPNNVATQSSLVHSYIRLDSYRGRDLDPVVLSAIGAGLSAIRNAGLKVIPRFSYNFGPYPNCNPDASEYWIKRHIAQVAAVLNDNKDVIAWYEAGFVGCWGEWHTSTNNLEGDAGAKQRIVSEMLARWQDRSIQIRYPTDLRMLRSYSGFTSAQKERLGFHHDCVFAEEPWDYGTWGRGVWTNPESVNADKTYVAGNSVTAPTGGETCAVSSRSHCSTALNELSAQHWANLNQDFNADVLNIFKSEGCYDTIKKHLGYRFVLTSATFTTTVSSGSSYTLNFTVRNEGWGRMYNPRPVFAVLRSTTGGTSYQFDLSENAKLWGPGETKNISKAFTLVNVASGTYKLSLWLPDQATRLRGNPKYSVRFANQGMWDSGHNVLGTITVGGASSTSATCSDRVQNQGETGVDCGGPCSACSTGSTNLLSNPGFESGSLSPWTSWGGMSASPGGAQSGSWKGTIGCNTGGEQVVSVAPNARYTLSGFGMVTGGTWGSIGYQVLDAGNRRIDSIGDVYAPQLGSTWSQRTLTIDTPSNAAKVKVMFWQGSPWGCSGNEYVDSLSLIRK